MKIVSLAIVTMFLMGGLVFAGSTEDFIKGNDTEDPLMVSLYVAKTLEGKDEKKPDIRVKFERKNNIGNFNHAEYTASLGLEF